MRLTVKIDLGLQDIMYAQRILTFAGSQVGVCSSHHTNTCLCLLARVATACEMLATATASAAVRWEPLGLAMMASIQELKVKGVSREVSAGAGAAMTAMQRAKRGKAE